MKLIEYVGKRIQELRRDYNSGEGLSQEALAGELEVAANTISRWESATYRPGLEDLDKLARFFGVSILELFPPDDSVVSNDRISALLRTAKQLSEQDLEELRRYAEFRKARSIYGSGNRPRAGRKRKG